MKVIATTTDRKVLCEIDHSELEKFLGLYYGKMDRLKIGDEVDLGRGYDYHSDTVSAFQETKKFIEANEKIITAITNGLCLVSKES